jgi:hypothetical protein
MAPVLGLCKYKSPRLTFKERTEGMSRHISHSHDLGSFIALVAIIDEGIELVPLCGISSCFLAKDLRLIPCID